MTKFSLQGVSVKSEIKGEKHLLSYHLQRDNQLLFHVVLGEINVERRKDAIRVFVWMVAGGRTDGQTEGHRADLGYRWLHTCPGTLSSSGQ